MSPATQIAKAVSNSLFDSHCHFDFSVFDSNRDQLWADAKAAGVKGLVIPGVAPSNWPKAKTLAYQLENSFFAVGLHPWWVGEGELKGIARAEQLNAADVEPFVSDSRCVAIGECGLDALADSDFQLQHTVLDAHIDLAKNLNQPLILHCVKAHNPLLEQLKRHRFDQGGVVHAFSGSYELAMSYYDMGFALGIGGVVTYPRANKTRQTVTRLPLDAIMLETDAPDSPPQGWQGQRNQPANLNLIVQAVAELRNESEQAIAHASTQTAQRIFRLGSF